MLILLYRYQLAWPASPTEIVAEAKATSLFLLHGSSTLIKDIVPSFSDFDKFENCKHHI